jgi:hypothetical protein
MQVGRVTPSERNSGDYYGWALKSDWKRWQSKKISDRDGNQTAIRKSPDDAATKIAVQLLLGALPHRVKRPGREADTWCASSTEVNSTTPPLPFNVTMALFSFKRKQLNVTCSQDSVIGVVTKLWARQSSVRIPARARCFPFPAEVHLASRLTCIKRLLHGRKAAGAWGSPLTSNECRGKEWVVLYLHTPYMPSWRVQGQPCGISTRCKRDFRSSWSYAA